jgi:hypothetical protein
MTPRLLRISAFPGSSSTALPSCQSASAARPWRARRRPSCWRSPRTPGPALKASRTFRLPVMPDGLRGPILCHKSQAHIVVGHRGGRHEPPRLFVRSHCLVRASLLSAHRAHVEMAWTISRPDSHQLLEVRAGFGQLPAILEYLAEVLMGPARERGDRGMGPQRLRVMPHLDLLPGERGEGEHDERACSHEQPAGPCRLARRARGSPPGPSEPGPAEYGPAETYSRT